MPRGGLRLAEALKLYVTEGALLIVDDVLTTGASMEEFRNGREALGAVIFARGHCPSWVVPLFQMDAEFSLATLRREKDDLEKQYKQDDRTIHDQARQIVRLVGEKQALQKQKDEAEARVAVLEEELKIFKTRTWSDSKAEQALKENGE